MNHHIHLLQLIQLPLSFRVGWDAAALGGFVQARKRARELRAKRDERQAFLAEEAARKQAQAEEKRRQEIERRMRPRTTADFEILYNELEAWRLQV